MKHIYIFNTVYLPLILLTGCITQDDSKIPIYTVQQKDFIDTITIEGTVEPLKTLHIFCPSKIQGTAIYLVKDGAFVEEGEVVCVIQDNDLENEYESAVINLENAIAILNKTKADLDMKFALLEADVNNNKLTSEIANLDSLQLRYSSENLRKIRALELQKTVVEKKKIEQKLKALGIIQGSEIRRQEMIIKRHHNTIDNLSARIETLTIKAPQSGMVTRGIHWMTGNKIIEGDPVWEGLPIIAIPIMKEMKVVMNAPEADYKKIHLHNDVEYTFDAIPGNKAWGKITRKAPVGKPISKDSKVRLFEIEASIDGITSGLTPGLSSTCRITLTQIFDTITIPQIAVFEQDSMKVVYVKKNKLFEMRQITTGTSSLASTIVDAGLKHDEQIALLKPSDASIRGKTLLSDSILYNTKHTKQ